MNCRKIRKLLALHAGGDLSPSKAHFVERHLQACGACRREFASYEQSLRQAREWLDQTEQPWAEDSWRQALSRAVTSGSRPVRTAKSLTFRPAWSYAAVALMAAALTFLVMKPLPEPDIQRGPLAAAAPSSQSQDIVSLTLVSRESGLKVQWFLNRNFKLKEDSE